jgi:diguanylate cyclase (GGDEF)-like protein/PAS domain S-box-containing protein
VTFDRRVVHRQRRALARPAVRRTDGTAPARASRVPALPATQPAFAATVETILRHVHDAVFATDGDGTITFWAPSAERMFEYRAEQAVGRRFRDLLPTRIAEPSSAADFDATVSAGATWRGEGAVTLPSGRELWLESTVTPIVLGGAVSGSVSLSRDMTAEHRALRDLADRARLFQALSEYTVVANAIHDETRLAPAIIEAVAAVIPADYVVLTLLDVATGRYVIRATAGADGAVGAEVQPNEGSSGRAIAARALVVVDRLARTSFGPAVRGAIDHDEITTAAMPLIHDGLVLGSLTVARRWTPDHAFSAAEREALTLFGAQAALAVANVRLLAEVRELAVHDGLTGLYNRRQFDATLQLLLARWRRGGDQAAPLVAIMFDLDRFGRLNRDSGHQAGDAVLRVFGGILHERLRSSDLVARYGGEEFVAVLEGSTLADGVAVADAIRAALAARQIEGPDGRPMHATVSAGVAQLDPTEPTAEALLRAADVGLFLAKRGGRNRVVAT